MALIDVKYMMAESLTSEELIELGIPGATKGLIAVETTNPDLTVKGIVVTNYVDYLLSLGEKKE